MNEQEYSERYGRLGIISSAELTDRRFERTDWLAQGLLKPGLSVLAGAPKIGKSWMVLQLCMAVAKGEPFLGMPTRESSVLYITLEDSAARIQERINRITEESAENLYIAMSCSPLGEELAHELANFSIRHPDTRLIVIDTFQKIREQYAQMSYSGDYADTSYLKKVADELHITILLVHHTRKLGDSDVINEISGTNGIAGSADSLMILKKKKRTDSRAILSCTGRDIMDRSLLLTLNRESCLWQVISDDAEEQKAEPIPPILTKLIAYLQKIGEYAGSNTAFCRAFCAYAEEKITPNRLKYLMNRYRYDLEDAGVSFLSVKKTSGRELAIYYQPPGGTALVPEDAEEEEALFVGFYPDQEEIPLPTDDDAPPEAQGR